jgi:hypothetical protein
MTTGTAPGVSGQIINGRVMFHLSVRFHLLILALSDHHQESTLRGPCRRANSAQEVRQESVKLEELPVPAERADYWEVAREIQRRVEDYSELDLYKQYVTPIEQPRYKDTRVCTREWQ